jgi:hypothetical protein
VKIATSTCWNCAVWSWPLLRSLGSHRAADKLLNVQRGYSFPAYI